MVRTRSTVLSVLSTLASLSTSVTALDSGITVNEFALAGTSGVSAQQMFVGQDNQVYILDKTENNALQINGHPAWVAMYDPDTQNVTAMDMTTNTFCACGTTLADGRWVIVGGNNAVATGGVTVNDTTGNPYDDNEGGDQIRLLTPGDSFEEGITTVGGPRWYPTTETLADGSIIIVGGCTVGAYINADYQNVPTYEYYPDQSAGAIGLSFLNDTMPLNLYALMWLLPSGKLFMQAAYKTILYDMDTKVETSLQDMPYAVRVYPANAAVSMLPLTPANNYTAEIVFCGGTNLTVAQFGADTGPSFPITQYPADNSCVRIKPDDATPTYVDEDDLPEGRVMGNFILLPNGKLFLVNGIASGTAGYGTANDPKVLPRSEDADWVIGQSFGDNPILAPAMYDPNAKAGERFSRKGLGNSTVPRLYHSSATLLADGSILVSGSNPNADVSTVHWGTEYRVEKFYPEYYNEARPNPSGMPVNLTYGGTGFDLSFSSSDLNGNMSNIETAKVVVIRPGYSTHAVNFGQRMLELNSTYDGSGSSGVLHVSQMPPNAGTFQPGPALIFAVVNGVPSIGQWVTIGSGAVGSQPLATVPELPANVKATVSTSKNNPSSTADGGSTSSSTKSSAVKIISQPAVLVLGLLTFIML